MSKTFPHLFCEQPFTRLEIGTDGETFTCCPSWLPKPIGNLATQSFDDVWNSKAAEEIRASIHDGSFRFCRQDLCPRLMTEDMPKDKITRTDLLSLIQSGATKLEQRPERVNCCYDRSCNLSCPSCRIELILHKRGSAEFMQAEAIQNQILSELPSLEWLEITGSGDPFASPLFFDLLKTINAKDYPKLKIFLHTNGTLWNEQNWQEIAGIQSAVKKVEISIDAATEETYSLNRRGGKFSSLLKNLKLIAKLRETGPITDLKISFVVQQNNFHEMDQFIALGLELNVDRIYFSKLDQWGTFTADEFQARAVHLPEHPDHGKFLQALRSPNLRNPKVDLGNLINLSPSA